MGLLEDKQCQLQQVNNAITAILQGAQEYWIGSRRLRRAELKTLTEERRRLEVDIANLGGSTVTVAYFDGR